ncbi:hypothetical protein CC85DRAFT_288771 [Cutaneotrichosporon oleaginosum]|uniref:Glycosyltransferase family 18 catalytic domain-containing protein n=1 Tax=Cutaneotrichosporon oleaginosum TaxID=879819 RepID=A0A0J0XDR5_9TREE|nr:uncharacterized protein CC85DRAFT_288771 [Cutaneotrichosporon oleaginosum]KLT39212.1 hypothetical protein CC85DRAFT_288771 [Cutaneotrichosporon oleaginosum]TXT05705.1 hypothetical protein COLE_07025 [Cutaneotrichosporon oleaginosum]
MALPRVSRPLLAALAITLGFLLVAAGHRHQTGRWAPAAAWPDIRVESAYSDEIERFTHDPEGLTLYNPKKPFNYMWKNEAKLRRLAVCMERGDCHENALKFVVIGAYHCHLAVFDNYRGGEGIWCMNMIESLERQGYTVLFAGEGDWKYMAHLHRQFPEYIRVVLADDGSLEGGPPVTKLMMENIKTKDNPNGVPAWKFFRFSFFPNGLSTIVGQRWSAIAEPEWKKPTDQGWRNMTYLGYAIPDEDPEIIPFHDRPMRAYILSKRVQYFYDVYGKPMIGRDQITRAYHELRQEFPTFEFVGAFIDDRSKEQHEALGPMEIPEGVRNLGKLGPEAWAHEVSNSRAMVGIGFPVSSPSPYQALARGVPFINPHRINEGHDPNDPYTWFISQHEFLRILSPPEVYQYPEYDYDAFVDAIRQAMTHEMKPHLLERLTRKALDQRMRDWVEADWRHAASVILENRLNGHETEYGPSVGVFEL